MLQKHGFFLWIDFTYYKATASEREDSILLNTKFPGNPGTHLINLKCMTE